jgi:hypothetical protein
MRAVACATFCLVGGNRFGSAPKRDTFSVTGTEASRFEAVQQNSVWVLALKAGVSLDYEAGSSINVTVRASDGSLTYDEVMTVTVNNVNEAPSDITSSPGPALIFASSHLAIAKLEFMTHDR